MNEISNIAERTQTRLPLFKLLLRETICEGQANSQELRKQTNRSMMHGRHNEIEEQTKNEGDQTGSERFSWL